MEVNEILKYVMSYGGTVVMAGLFVWIFIEDRKNLKEEKEKNTTVLKELSASNNNIAESLNLLKTSMDNTTTEFKQHDERAIKNFNNIDKQLIVIKENIRK